MPAPTRDLSPRLRAAGCKGVPDVGVSGSLVQVPAPATPDNLKPYRLSHTGQIGFQSSMSPRRAKDPQIPKDTVFGDANNYSDNAATCLSHGKPCLGEKIHQYKSDKAEPLGRARQYQYPLPPGSDIKVWGKVEAKSEAAKGILYPSNHMTNQGNHTKEAGYQSERGYNWNGNVNEMRFGRQGPGLEKNFEHLGTSDATTLVPSPTKAAREARHAPMGSTLLTGTAPAKAYDSSKTFGRTTQKHDGNDNVRYLMHGGDVPPKDDDQLGAFTYTSPRLRRQKTDDRQNRQTAESSRSFGVPSVRTDKKAPEPHQVKVTCGIGYAGDADAGALLYQGDRSTVYNKGLSVDECLALNDKCMLGLQISEVRQAHAYAAKRGTVTAGSFSHAVADMGL